MMGWWLSLLYVIPDHDFKKQMALHQLLQTGTQYYEPGNKWEVWIKFIDYFEGSLLPTGNHRTSAPSPYNPADVIEFLLENYSRDDVFGNMTREVARELSNNQRFIIYKPRERSIRRPQRKRGYNDKGFRPIIRPKAPKSGIKIWGPETANQKLRREYRERIKQIGPPEMNNWVHYPSRSGR